MSSFILLFGASCPKLFELEANAADGQKYQQIVEVNFRTSPMGLNFARLWLLPNPRARKRMPCGRFHAY